MSHTPQLFGSETSFCPQSMIIPSSDEGVKVSPESRDKDVVHTKEVYHIRDIKQTIFLQRVKDIMVLASDWVTATQTSRQSRSILEWNLNWSTSIYTAICAFIEQHDCNNYNN